MRIVVNLPKTLSRDQSASALPFQLHTVRGKLVQPNLDLDRISALVAIDDEADFANAHGDHSG